MKQKKFGDGLLSTVSKRAFSAVLVGALAFAASFAFAGQNLSKCDAAIALETGSTKNETIGVIVAYSVVPSAQDERRLKDLGADIYRHLPIIHALAVRIEAGKLQHVLSLPHVAHLSQDEEVQKTDAFTVDSSYANVAYSQYGLTGTGVTVAVIDSGVGAQLDFDASNGSVLGSILGLLGTRVVAQVGFVPGDGVGDDCGHGTHVAGIIAGNGASSSGLTCFNTYYGVARLANIASVKVLDAQGVGTVSQVVSGIQWAVANSSKYKIKIINLSLGHPVGQSYTTDPLCQAVEAAWKAGIVVVCAAGNDGRLNASPTNGEPNGGYDTNYGSIEVPGNDPYVITVGATKSMDGLRADDQIATYSSRGPSLADFVLKPDIVAPGNQVISVEQPNTYLVQNYQATNQVPYSDYTISLTPSQSSNNYFRLSGTSMACPVISAAAAMLLQKNPNLSPDTIKMRLMVSADKWADPYGNGDACTYGAGYIDIPAAYKNTLVATQYAMSPSLSVDSSGDVFVNFNGNPDWNMAIWGSQNLNSLAAIWGQRAIWGESNELSSSHAIWGKSFWSGDTNTTSISSAGVDLSAGSIAIQGE